MSIARINKTKQTSCDDNEFGLACKPFFQYHELGSTKTDFGTHTHAHYVQVNIIQNVSGLSVKDFQEITISPIKNTRLPIVSVKSLNQSFSLSRKSCNL